jgi:Cys-tRNA(Pro) deacylase
MSKMRIPQTPALRALRAAGAAFSLHTYAYEEKGGTRVSSDKLGVDEHIVIKTLVMEDEKARPLLILMHGDKEVSTKELARTLGVKSITPCKPETARRHTGYMVGGTSPFGTKKELAVYMEKTIADLPEILINAGARGLLAKMSPAELTRILHAREVSVAI